MKILISDKMSDLAVNILQDDFEVSVDTGNSEKQLIEKIKGVDGLIVRSDTKVTKDVFVAATDLKVVGRAGIGVDNIDLEAAALQGVVVMNTPYGNSVTTAEHTIALMLSLARKIPWAYQSMTQGEWSKSNFKGIELSGKVLGLIGCGNIGSIVADRAQGLKMKVWVYDPFLIEDVAIKLGVKKVDLDELLKQSDFISVHTPINEQTRGLLGRENLNKIKKGACLINCARGEIVDEKALVKALDGHLWGAAFDVFSSEPLPPDSPLRSLPNLLITPHLGASTMEAQEKVAVQVADQIKNFLLRHEVVNGVNTISLSQKDYQILAPFVSLVKQIGSFISQVIVSGVRRFEISYYGKVATYPTQILLQETLCSLLESKIENVNAINSLLIAQNKQIDVSERFFEKSNINFQSLIKVEVKTEKREYSIVGGLFGTQPRLVEINGVHINVELDKHNIYLVNQDKPGLVKAVASILSNHQINIATFNLGRTTLGGEAITVITVDEEVSREVLQQIVDLPLVVHAKYVCI